MHRETKSIELFTVATSACAESNHHCNSEQQRNQPLATVLRGRTSGSGLGRVSTGPMYSISSALNAGLPCWG